MYGAIVLCLIFAFSTTVNSLCRDKNLLDCAHFLGSEQFSSLVQRALISNEFSYGPGNKTLLLPSRVALDNISPSVMIDLYQNQDFLRDVLRYHLLSKPIACSQMTDNSLVETSQGAKVRFNRYSISQVYPTDRVGQTSSMVTVEGGTLLPVEADASNGHVCIIGNLLYQIPSQSIYDYVSEDETVSTFLLLAAKSGLLNALTGSDLTLLVPDDSAFSKLKPGVVERLLKNTALMKEILLNHIADKVYFSEGLKHIENLTAVSGKDYQIKRAGQEKHIGWAKIVTADIPMSNGVVHIIDTVLMNATGIIIE